MSLFKEDAVFISRQNAKDKVFKEISKKLSTKGYVKNSFLKNISERELNYPTGMDMTILGDNIPNVAIPHTEAEHVNDTLIVPVKLKEAVQFKNMINPDETLDVSYLFMILNNNSDEQANILSLIMDFLNKDEPEELKDFFELDNTDEIYNYLVKKF